MRLLSQIATLVALAVLTPGVQSTIEPRSSSGCGKSHDFVGQTRGFSLNSTNGGGLRKYTIHLPSSYAPRIAKPLLIAYHGYGGNATHVEKQTRFSDNSVNPHMIVVYPEGINNAWQGPDFATRGINDEAFTTDLVNLVKSNYCVDESRVYAAGFSNGGGFVNTLACSRNHGGQFAGFAAVAGAFWTDVAGNDGCAPSRSPMPMFELHGTSDERVPWMGRVGGRGGSLPAIPEWVKRWSQRNKCGVAQEANFRGYQHTAYDCRGVLALETVRIEGHDHSWPGPGSKFDVSPAIIKFLNRHRKP